jgi:signal transduction histidine kinase
MGVPLLHKERVIGMLGLSHTTRGYYTEQHGKLALAIANQAAVAIENARLYAQAQEVAALEERHRLARELHDSVAQALYGVTMYAEAAHSLLCAGEQEQAAGHVRAVRETAHTALAEMRLLIFELRPPILEQEGLAAALQARLAAVESRVAGLTASLSVEGEILLPVPIEEALYRLAQESLNNVFKHAGARNVTLTLRQCDGRVLLEVEDDGAGFDRARAARHGGAGLRGMAERAEQIGGHLTVDSVPGQGTRVRVEVEV